MSDTGTLLWSGQASHTDTISVDGYSRLECSDGANVETLTSPFNALDQSSPNSKFYIETVSGGIQVWCNYGGYYITKVTGYK